MAEGTVALTWGHLISCFLSPPVRPPTGTADLRRTSCCSGPAHHPPNPRDRLSRDTHCPASHCLRAMPGEEEAPIRSFLTERLERNSCCHRAGRHTWPTSPYKGDPHSRAERGGGRKEDGAMSTAHHCLCRAQWPPHPPNRTDRPEHPQCPNRGMGRDWHCS